jgi:hypothetical protein
MEDFFLSFIPIIIETKITLKSSAEKLELKRSLVGSL